MASDSEFCMACYWNNVEQVQRLIAEGTDVNGNNGEALRFASLRGNYDTVVILLKNGANIHANNDEAIRFASSEGAIDVVKLLVENGANIHANNDEALFLAEDYKNNRYEQVIAFLKECEKEEFILAVAGTYNKKSYLKNMADDWLYDRRIWTRIKPFV